jgi:pimeloyl-ACP methyl ester carboxylesterase
MKPLRSLQHLIVSLIVLIWPLSAQAPSSGYVAVGPDKIFYDLAGQGSVIVCIHDGNLHREVWDEQLSYFSKNHRVVRYDRRGYGKSLAASAPYTNLDDLNALFAALRIDKACLMGMSAGGRLAVDFALRYPEKVTSLVLVGAVVGGLPFTSHMTDRGGHQPQFGTGDAVKYLEQSRLYYVTEDPYTIFSENRAAKEKAKRLVLENPRHPGVSRNEPTEAVPAYRRLAEIKVPALILVGEYDIPDVHAHAGALNAGIPGSRRDVIRRSAHLAPLEQPEAFNRAVAEFLAGVEK